MEQNMLTWNMEQMKNAIIIKHWKTCWKPEVLRDLIDLILVNILTISYSFRFVSYDVEKNFIIVAFYQNLFSTCGLRRALISDYTVHMKIKSSAKFFTITLNLNV